MKPTFFAESGSPFSRHDFRPGRKTAVFPQPAFEFQPRRGGNFFPDDGPPRRKPGFSRLADEVLRADASRSFRLEAAVLGLVALVAAWPIAIMIHEVYRLLQ